MKPLFTWEFSNFLTSYNPCSTNHLRFTHNNTCFTHQKSTMNIMFTFKHNPCLAFIKKSSTYLGQLKIPFLFQPNSTAAYFMGQLIINQWNLCKHGSQRHMVGENTKLEGLHLYRSGLSLPGANARQVTKRGQRLTSACLMTVRNIVTGFLGNRCCKDREGRKTGPQTPSPVTHWQMWGSAPPMGAQQRKGPFE